MFRSLDSDSDCDFPTWLPLLGHSSRVRRLRVHERDGRGRLPVVVTLATFGWDQHGFCHNYLRGGVALHPWPL